MGGLAVAHGGGTQPWSLRLAISVWVHLLPTPGVFTHRLDAKLGLPAQQLLGTCRIGITNSDVTTATIDNLVGHGLTASITKSRHHLQHTERTACA